MLLKTTNSTKKLPWQSKRLIEIMTLPFLQNSAKLQCTFNYDLACYQNPLYAVSIVQNFQHQSSCSIVANINDASHQFILCKRKNEKYGREICRWLIDNHHITAAEAKPKIIHMIYNILALCSGCGTHNMILINHCPFII